MSAWTSLHVSKSCIIAVLQPDINQHAIRTFPSSSSSTLLDQRHVDIISAENYICYHGAFSYHHYSIPTSLSPSVVSLRFALSPLTLLRTARDGCLRCGKCEIKRKSLINWQQAPQDREAGDGMINLTWGWSGWWMCSRVRCSAGTIQTAVCVLCFMGIRVFGLCAGFVQG